jgi:hypothetical protein
MRSVAIWKENEGWYARIFSQISGPYHSYSEAMSWLEANGEYQS